MKLINHVLDIRRLIQQAFDNRFSRMGLRAEEEVPADQLNNDDHRERRKKLDNIMASHLAELGDYVKARQAAINECVFTLFNRIAAIKVMEAKELFPEIIRRRKENAGRSFEHNAWLEEHPDERNAEREGLKHFLQEQFDKLGEHIPLYRADYPYALMPTADELNEIIVQFNSIEDDPDCGEDVWKGDDILGWLYENFNAVEKEALKTSGEKTEYNKVSLQSQVYTPAWVVKFLVDNTLGKTYLEMYPDSRIKEKYKIANAPTKQVKYPKNLQKMRLLDPACGSGNFLIYAFSLFYDLYVDQMENYNKDYSRRDIPKLIVENNLYGIDLDERAAQITQIALFVKARVLGGHRSHWPEYTNIVSTHFFLPEYEKIEDTFEILGEWNSKQKATITEMWNDLCSAYKFGSLVRVEDRMNVFMPNEVNHSQFKDYEMQRLFDFKNNVTTQLRNQVNQWSGEGSNQYTLAKTNEAMDFLQIISQRYDVVVANPPYTDSADYGPELRAFVENNYKRPYKVHTNLYSCFIRRCSELAGDGKVGMVNPPTFMFIKTFEDLRDFMLNEEHISIFLHWGYLGMFTSTARVDSAAFVIEKDNFGEDSTFIKLDDVYEGHRYSTFVSIYDDICNNIQNDRVYVLHQNKLKEIKTYPFIYWISDEFRKKFAGKSVEELLKPAQGAATTNNNKYLRFWWEVSPDNISKDNKVDHKKWVGYSKGGPFTKWYGNVWLLVNWENDGYELKNSKAVLRNSDCYFQEGITYSASGSRSMGVAYRVHPVNSLFDTGGSCVFPRIYTNVPYIMAFLNSKLSSYISDCLNPTVNIQVGDIQRVPFEIPTHKIEEIVCRHALQCIEIRKHICEFSIIEQNYCKTPISNNGSINSGIKEFYTYENGLNTIVLLNESVINQEIFKLYELSNHDRQMVIDKEKEPVGNLSVSKEAKESFLNWIKSSKSYSISEEVKAFIEKLPETSNGKALDDLNSLYQNNNEFDKYCIRHEINPIEAWYQFNESEILPSQRTQVLSFELLTEIVRSILSQDDDGVIPLGDKMGEERLAIRIEREFMERGYSAAQFSQVCHLLGCPLEKYLQEHFFKQLSDHLNLFMYLPKTPFIWHLTSGKHHAIELYISIYKWTRDTLFRIRSIYAANREAAIRDRLNSIDTSKTEDRQEATELRAMLAELENFCKKIDDLLASGYNPKLDDGVGKNIAPLQKRKMISYEVLNAGQLKKYLNADW